MDFVAAIKSDALNIKKRTPVEPDFWVLIFGDLTVFSVLFIAFMLRRFESAETHTVFSMGTESLNQSIGLINTLVLLTSSYAVVLALSYYRSGDLNKMIKFTCFAIFCGLGFVCLKIFEYIEKINQGITVTADRFFELYFTFTGIHLLHVLIGISLLTIVAYRMSLKKPDAFTTPGFVEGVTCYWHMVDLLWLILFALFYLLG
ncbi:hypothetical protein A9Q99_01420 [Gammaproteobacteria bacterium 45_16_T64]|nr:hypothetical protein A9Q99_01420 [Gammaproteobacteria bacterium 45_16_T64]